MLSQYNGDETSWNDCKASSSCSLGEEPPISQLPCLSSEFVTVLLFCSYSWESCRNGDNIVRLFTVLWTYGFFSLFFPNKCRKYPLLQEWGQKEEATWILPQKVIWGLWSWFINSWNFPLVSGIFMWLALRRTCFVCRVSRHTADPFAQVQRLSVGSKLRSRNNKRWFSSSFSMLWESVVYSLFTVMTSVWNCHS